MSRLTFRSPVTDVAWQRQLRDRYLSDGVPAHVPHLDLARSEIRPVSSRLAASIILRYEWLGTMASSRYHFGIFFGTACAGVTCFSLGNGTGGVAVPKQFGIRHDELATLARGACVHWAPTGANSRLVSWSCRLLRRITRCKLVIAYADTDAGEIGTIYQSCNWTYIGRSGVTRQWVAPNGRIYDQKLPWDLKDTQGGTRAAAADALRAAGWTEQPTNPKHRYVFLLDRTDRALAERVEALRRPYPKRPGSIAGDATAHQAAEGGSTPTSGLHHPEAAYV